uniref:Salivary antigen-5 n=1 Tax=Dipetalogaster maximus TaxID=72496 RepID=VA5_DIPMA
MAKTQCPLVFSLLALALIGTLQSSAAQCQNSNQFLGSLEITGKYRKAVVSIHNYYRNLTAAGEAGEYYKQPPAENMLQLTWDDDAASKAVELANTCVFGHDGAKDKDDKPMGQNIALKMSSTQSDVNKSYDEWMTGMVKDWFDEVKDYSFGSGFSSGTGHYTQIVWANTSKVGCGYSYYKEGTWYAGYLVCNYKPPGNWYGQDPYIQGNVNCEKHNLGRSKNYNNLCVTKRKKKNNKSGSTQRTNFQEK